LHHDPWGGVALEALGAVDVDLDADMGLIAARATTDRMTFVVNLSNGCLADFDADGSLTVLDFIAFQLAFVAGDPRADCDESDTLDVLDFACFQAAFLVGCG